MLVNSFHCVGRHKMYRLDFNGIGNIFFIVYTYGICQDEDKPFKKTIKTHLICECSGNRAHPSRAKVRNANH